MVSKCANPACSTPFHYLREGKIFRVEIEAALTEKVGVSNGNHRAYLVGQKKPTRKLEHFWLCGPCAQSMNLLFDKDSGILVVPKVRARAAVAAAS